MKVKFLGQEYDYVRQIQIRDDLVLLIEGEGCEYCATVADEDGHVLSGPLAQSIQAAVDGLEASIAAFSSLRAVPKPFPQQLELPFGS